MLTPRCRVALHVMALAAGCAMIAAAATASAHELRALLQAGATTAADGRRRPVTSSGQLLVAAESGHGDPTDWPAKPSRGNGTATDHPRQLRHAPREEVSGFLASEATVRSFPWGEPARSVQQAFDAAFPGGERAWTPVRFAENPAEEWTREAVIRWVDQDLLGGPDPFADWGGGRVPLPWPAEAGGDQLGRGGFVGYSRRQVAFVAAKSLVGAATPGYGNGLLRFMENADFPARAGTFGRSWWTLLAACAADPSLEGSQQGPQLVVAKAGAPTSAGEVRRRSAGAAMEGAGLRVCHFSDGVAQLEGETPVPEEGCSPPSEIHPGVDFVSGGLPGQATQDISASWLGGYVLGHTSDLGGGLDERLVLFFPEVSILTFFLSESPSFPQLRQPAWILGARKIGLNLDGTARFDAPVITDRAVPMTSDLLDVGIDGRQYKISGLRPFLAFMSESQGFLKGGADLLGLARRNRLPAQREVDPGRWFAFDKQVQAWYGAVSLQSYNPAVRLALKQMVRSLGSGPWLAGLWFGDSQVGFLASWIGHAVAAGSWGKDGSPPLDYYSYSDFTENPGNQCYILPGKQCRACLQRCIDNPLPEDSFWLPDDAYMGRDQNQAKNPCVFDGEDSCGEHGLDDVLKAYASKTADDLWRDVEAALGTAGVDTSRSVFDLLLSEASLKF